MSSRHTRDDALEKKRSNRRDERTHTKNSRPILHLLQAQQAPALLYAKAPGRPSTEIYPALLKECRYYQATTDS